MDREVTLGRGMVVTIWHVATIWQAVTGFLTRRKVGRGSRALFHHGMVP
jgi:hypothetical protein